MRSAPGPGSGSSQTDLIASVFLRAAREQLEAMVRWYASVAYGRWEGPGRRPFYCDPSRIGAFAVVQDALAAGREPALFRLLVTLAMYQSRRDVDIMAIQRGMRRAHASGLTARRRLSVVVEDGRCEHLGDPNRFDASCDVRRDFTRAVATCGHRPRTPCHVKDATLAIGRMGDMGKLPTSAWLHVQAAGGLRRIADEAAARAATPALAADLVVERLARIHRIGVKLATMYVSALATPALAPGLTPWWPRLDGNHLVVVDANVGRVIDALRPSGARSFAARAAWFRRVAATIDLRQIRRAWPRSSPRLVQQAVYLFRSRSNRIAAGDPCGVDGPCENCVARLCPFAGARS